MGGRGSGARLALAALLLALDLLILPAVARIRPPPPGRGSTWFRRDLPAWRDTWLRNPLRSGMMLVRPRTEVDRQARTVWLWMQVLVGTGILMLLWPAAPIQAGVPPPDPSGAHGTARWRPASALRFTMRRVRIGGRVEAAGLLAGVDRQREPRTAWLVPGPDSPAPVNPHVLVIGASGAGKTRRLVLPGLWLLGQAKAAGKPNSLVVTDPKGELYAHTADYFRRLGYQVRTLNLIDPRRSDRFNPLTEIAAALERGDVSAASEAAWDLAHVFVSVDQTKQSREDPFWSNAAESMIAAAVLYVARHAPPEHRTPETVYRLVTELGAGGGKMLDVVYLMLEDLSDPAKMAYGVTALSEDRTRSSILTSAAVALRLFADRTVADMTRVSDYDLAAVGREPTVFYLLLPDDKSSRNSLAAVHLQQMYSALTRLAQESPGGRLPVPVYWMLDEFANIGRFRDFDKMISVMRGRNMAVMIVLQALQQLEARYGRETADVIVSNCDTWLYLRTNDHGTAKKISEKLGKYTIRTRTGSSTARRFDVSTGSNEHLHSRDLLTPDEVLRWQPGQVLIMQAGQQPARLALADLSEWPATKDLRPDGPPPAREDPPAPEPWLPDLSMLFSGATPAAPPGPSPEPQQEPAVEPEEDRSTEPEPDDVAEADTKEAKTDYTPL